MRNPVLMLALVLCAAGTTAVAHDYAAQGLKIAHPWARPAAQGGNGAAYLTITNTGRSADVLVGLETPAARRAEMHRTTMTNGIMAMRPVQGGLAIPGGASVAFAPGKDHIMLIGLNKALVKGGRVPATLVFQKAGRVAIELTVEQGPAAEPEHKHH